MVGPFDSTFTRRTRSGSPANHASMSSRPSRISLLPSARLASLLRQDAQEELPSHDKPALLTLKVSSRTFIDSVVTDDVSNTPLYILKTTGVSTTITRNSSTGGTMQFASVKWPKILPTRLKGREVTDGVDIQMGNARYLGGETLLSIGPKPSSSRRFTIPNYSHTLKWKRRGDIYWCSTPNLKGPVAILEPAKDESPTKLTIYETLRDKYDSRSVLYHQGVYILLLDYLIVTTMLLLTDIQEWMLVKKHDDKNVIIPNPLGGSSSSVEASTPQWRKIMYREPIYPKLSGESSSNPSAAVSQWFTNSSRSRCRLYESVRSSLQTNVDQSLLSLSSDSEDDEDDLREDADVHTRTSSPVESTNYPHTPSHAPPVPAIPSQYAKSTQSLRDGWSSNASSPRSNLRELPRPPSQQAGSSPRTSTVMDMPQAPHQPTPAPISTAEVYRARSLTTARGCPSSRPLPAVPHASTSSNAVRRSRSQATLAEDGLVAPLPPFHPPPTNRESQRSLPPTPISLDPSSPRPEVIQEELRMTAAAVHMIRRQHQAPTIRIPSSPLRKSGHGGGDEDDVGQWVHVLANPSGRALPVPPTMIYDIPPPAYSDSLSYDRSGHKPSQLSDP